MNKCFKGLVDIINDWLVVESKAASEIFLPESKCKDLLLKFIHLFSFS